MKQRKGSPKGPTNIKVPKVRTKKWIHKKNGLFGWVSCVVPSQGRAMDPQNSKGGGGLKVKMKGLETKTESADRHPANVDKERGGKSSC